MNLRDTDLCEAFRCTHRDSCKLYQHSNTDYLRRPVDYSRSPWFVNGQCKHFERKEHDAEQV